MEAVKKNPRSYYVALWLMLIFVFNDLVFDFLFNFDGSDLISLCFTLAASAIVFVWNGKLKKTKLTGEFEEISTFIKSNFDNWQVVFSILDIVCGIVSVLSGLAFLACIFKALKFIYIPTKIAVVTNKNKTLIKAITKSSVMWTLGRTATKSNKGETNVMKKLFKNIKNNPRTIAFGLISGGVFGIAAFEITRALDVAIWLKYTAMGVAAVLGFLGCCLIGWDNIKSAVLFVAKKKLSEENYDKLVNTADELMKAQENDAVVAKELKEAEKLAKIEAKKAEKIKRADEKEALALLKRTEKEDAKKAKEAEAEAKKLAEVKAEEDRKAKLLALAEEIKAKKLAEEKAKAEDRPQE